MKRTLIFIILLSGNINLVYPNNSFISDYIESTLKIVETFDYLKSKRGKLEFDTLYINTNGAINYDMDTTISGTTFIFSPYREDIFFAKGDIWFETILYKKVNDRIEYEFCFNSFNKIPDFEYYKGVAKCTYENNKWSINKIKTKKIDYEKTSKFTFPYNEPRKVKSFEKFYFNIKRITLPDKNSLSYTILGDWYYYADSMYVEALYTSNYIYQYSYIFGQLPTYEYYVKNDSLFIQHIDRVSKYKMESDSPDNNLTFYQTYIGENDSNVDTTIAFKFEMFRIPENEFTMSDFKGWKEVTFKNGRTKFGRKQMKYYKEFLKRREKYMEKYAL